MNLEKSESAYFTHLGHNLKNQETVCCPFLGCGFKTNKFKTFSSHRSRKNKLQLHVSKSSKQKIVEELNDILHFSSSHSLRRIKEVLTEHGIEVDDRVVQEINDAAFKTNPLILSTEGKGVLSTDHRRNLYFKEHFSLIEPTKYT